MSLWLVTPAWQRFDLSAVCLEQHRRVIDTLAEFGVEAHQVVVADDANLEIARDLGFDVVVRDNEWLGRKFNDGIEYAGKHGAEWIVPIGSDSWIDPHYFLPLPSVRETRTSAIYCAVTADRLAELRVGRNGAGPYMFHRSLLTASGFRPADDQLHRGIDGSTIRGIKRPLRWSARDLHTLQYVGFRHEPLLTPYERLTTKWGVAERDDPWDRLARYFPADLVDRVRLVMSSQAVAA